MENIKESTSILEEFRTLEKEFGSNKAHAIMNFLIRYNELLLSNLVTKDQFNKEMIQFHKEMSSLAWKLAGFLIAQVAVIVTLIKLLP
ncbi:MAG: hypothetical protein ACFHWX_13665 [Bacteroidota bacterium]